LSGVGTPAVHSPLRQRRTGDKIACPQEIDNVIS
jgi:hypothetical protein